VGWNCKAWTTSWSSSSSDPAALAWAAVIGCWPSSAEAVHAVGRPIASASWAQVTASLALAPRVASPVSFLVSIFVPPAIS
jgi:hypothetical protein